jgi:hypothetical protein
MYDDAEYYNFEYVSSTDEIDKRLVFYDWLANSGATSHITHQRDAFHTYEAIPVVSIAGVGRLKAHTIGKRSIHLKSEYNRRTYILELQNVLHVPNNRNNLLSLGQWEANGRSIFVYNGKMTLLTKEGKLIVRGTKVCNKLYKMTFRHEPGTMHSDCAFNMASPSITWETWH